MLIVLGEIKRQRDFEYLKRLIQTSLKILKNLNICFDVTKSHLKLTLARVRVFKSKKGFKRKAEQILCYYLL